MISFDVSPECRTHRRSFPSSQSFGIQFVKIMILDGLVYNYKCQSGLKTGRDENTMMSVFLHWVDKAKS